MKSFMELASERYSVRDYLDKEIPAEDLETILKAGALAPTAVNYQPQRIYVVKDKAVIDRLRDTNACVFNAPVVLVIAYDDNIAAKLAMRPGYCFGETDDAIVGTHMMLQAAELGIGSCWVGRFNEDDVKAVLGLPENIRVMDLMPMGYASEKGTPSPRHELSRPLDEMVTFI